MMHRGRKRRMVDGMFRREREGREKILMLLLE